MEKSIELFIAGKVCLVLTNKPFYDIIHPESEVNEMYIKHFICPYCGKELLNQNEFVDCDNENEFWCDNCEITFIEEDGEIVEE
jgi:transposase-like protein